MPRKSSSEALLKKFEKEKTREFVLDLHRLKKTYNHIMAEVERVFKRKISKSTVQYIIKNFKGRASVAERPKSGRPTKMSNQYVCHLLAVHLWCSTDTSADCTVLP